MLGWWELQYLTKRLSRPLGEVTLEQRPRGSKGVSHAEECSRQRKLPVLKPDMLKEQQEASVARAKGARGEKGGSEVGELTVKALQPPRSGL